MKKNQQGRLNLPFVTAVINGIEVERLLDTGANRSVINKEALPRLKLTALEIPAISMDTAGKAVEARYLSKCGLSLKGFANAIFLLEVLVIETLPVELIFGNDFLYATQSNIYLYTNTVRFMEYTIPLKTQQSSPRRSKLLHYCEPTIIQK